MHSPVPGFARSLGALKAILRKGEQSCADLGIAASALLEARLAPTMKPLTHQIRLSCNAAAGAAALIAGRPAVAIDGPYVTFQDCYQRIDEAQALIALLPPEAFTTADERPIPINGEDGETCPAHQYLSEYALPNFYFAMTTAYALLRHHGVPLGKTDFLGG